LTKSIYGGTASHFWNNAELGLSGSATSLESSLFEKTLGSASLFFNLNRLGLECEAAYSQSGTGLLISLARQSARLRAWHYDHNYLNLQSSGLAYPDYSTYKIEEVGLSYRQPQRGESGILGEYKKLVGAVGFITTIQAWVNSQERPSFDGAIESKIPIQNNLSARLKISGRTGAISDKVSVETGLDIRRWFDSKFWNLVRIERGQINRSKSLVQVYCFIPCNNIFFFGARARSYFDGKTEYFLEEKTIIRDGCVVKATYRWRHADGGQLGPLYLVVECAL